MKLIRRKTFDRIHQRLVKLYGVSAAAPLAERLYMLIGRYGVESRIGGGASLWNEKDVLLIAYGDSVKDGTENPLQTLRRFCNTSLAGAVNTVHILPFNPASSDGGFSVIDYRKVAPELGQWRDIEQLRSNYGLMFDLVLNHCSRSSEWFKNYTNGVAPERDFFIEVDPDEDLSQVTRPRPWPLLTPVETSRGTKHVWTTFSPDQIDVNFASPDVLFEFLDILLMYVDKGARIIRLDAVAFLWKEIGTTCVHHEKTHEVVKLMRDMLAAVAPHVILLTETNVPHAENISYFGNGDEAQMVYNFALPPLLLHGLLRGDSSYLQKWTESLGELPENCTFLNFTACHDGIGVRPISSLVPDEEIDWLVEQTQKRGGRVNMRSMPDGSKSPYELNITYRDALSDPENDRLGMRRFLLSQAIALSFKGMPAVYFHSLMGERTWQEGMENGENRDGNRRRWDLEHLEDVIQTGGSGYAYIFGHYTKMLRTRRTVRAFHPDGGQELLPTKPDRFAFLRLGERETVLCWFNFSSEATVLEESWVKDQLGDGRFQNLLTGNNLKFENGSEPVNAYSALWLIREEA